MSTEPVAKKRPARPGMVRVVVSLTQEHHDYIETQAAKESPVFPRPVNEYLSIALEKNFQGGKVGSKALLFDKPA